MPGAGKKALLLPITIPVLACRSTPKNFNMRSFIYLFSFCLSMFMLTGSSLLEPANGSREGKPNIIFIMADDLGYSDDFGVGDIQAHYPSNKIPTPHLDRLVHQGRSFTDAHTYSAVCSPTRYGLLTGRYNWRTRLQEWVIAAYEPPPHRRGSPHVAGLCAAARLSHGVHRQVASRLCPIPRNDCSLECLKV